MVAETTGGPLTIAVGRETTMTGPAETVYRGEIEGGAAWAGERRS